MSTYNSKFIPALILFMFIFSSCSKVLESPSSLNGNNSQEKGTVIHQYTIAIESISADQKTIIGGFKSIAHNQVTILAHEHGVYADVILENVSSSTSPELIKCTGTSKTILPCTQEWLQSNPGECLRITETDGEFTSSNDCLN